MTAGRLFQLNAPIELRKSVEANLQAALDKRLAPPVATHAGHLTSTTSSSVQTQEIQGVTPRRDGNTVQLDRESSPTSSPRLPSG